MFRPARCLIDGSFSSICESPFVKPELFHRFQKVFGNREPRFRSDYGINRAFRAQRRIVIVRTVNDVLVIENIEAVKAPTSCASSKFFSVPN